ncbi:helix-turn-helix transcriptional regulator [Micromonospora sp. KC721]|uniref:helix-turn-helix transcriptional regulator n=1 Tax=Micromonospora sp. KC721 TaxID=2530380 RepID=UPI001049CB59|nr:XRE family transcriptional regulator [Micromonospora sp. KC721]
MAAVTDLGQFLRARRARLDPAELGLASFGRRRVPGLRREELAQLAGVSVDYYTRMEQSRVRAVSTDVLDAVARALRLDEDEKAHLHHLAAHRTRSRPPAPPQRVRPALRWLLESLTTTPALVLGRRMDILAWNPLGAALFVDFAAVPAPHRNLLRLMFLDESFRDLLPNWEECVRENVAYLRMDAGHHPDDPQLAALVGELSVKSDQFRRWWAEHPVRRKTSGLKQFCHPLLGPMELAAETLRLSDDPSQALVTYTAQPGTPSADALLILALAAPTHLNPRPAPLEDPERVLPPEQPVDARRVRPEIGPLSRRASRHGRAGPPAVAAGSSDDGLRGPSTRW